MEVEVGRSAELVLQNEQYRLYGTIDDATGSDVSIRLATRPKSSSALSVGQPVCFYLPEHGQLSAITARIVSIDTDVIRVKCVQCANVELKCDWKLFEPELPIIYRTNRSTNEVGAWTNATISKISPNGLCLLLKDPVEIPCNLELILTLTAEELANHLGEPIRAVGATRRVALEQDGRLALYVEFVGISIVNRIRLKQFVASILPPAESMRNSVESEAPV